MSLLFETIRLEDGKPLNMSWHEKRYQAAHMHCFGSIPTQNLWDGIDLAKVYEKGIYRLKVIYDQRSKLIEIHAYEYVPRRTLQMVQDNTITYPWKYVERSRLDHLFSLRQGADDVLIIRQGKVTDTSIGNILFYDGQEWLTPNTPLLAGTCRARLLSEQKIRACSIREEDLAHFSGFQVINALRGFDPQLISDIALIRQLPRT